MGIVAVILRPNIHPVLILLESSGNMYRKNIDHLGPFRSREAQNILSLIHGLRSALQLHPQSEMWQMLCTSMELTESFNCKD